MAEKIGRKVLMKKGDVLIAGLRNKTLAWAGEPVDTTTDEDAGYRKLLPDAEGQEQIDLSGDGVSKDALFRDIALSPGISTYLTDITMEWQDTGEILACDFKLTSYEEGMSYNEAVTFSYSLQSSGKWSYAVPA